MSHAEVFGFECPTCGETLGAKLPEKNMVIACSACGLEFAVKRPVKVREQHQRRHPCDFGGQHQCQQRCKIDRAIFQHVVVLD